MWPFRKRKHPHPRNYRYVELAPEGDPEHDAYRYGWLNDDLGVFLNEHGVTMVVVEHANGYATTHMLCDIKFLEE